MDELEISGRRYISTKRAGKDHKYHADYIGQLIRAKKVAGQKVGRSWYVDAESLAEYLGTEAPARKQSAPIARIIENPATILAAQTVDEVPVEEQIAEPIEVEQVAVVEEEATFFATNDASYIPIKINQQEGKKETPMFYRTAKEEREARTTLRYIADEGPLLPRIQKSPAHLYQEPRPAPVQTRIAMREREAPPALEIKYPQDVPVFVSAPPVIKRPGNKKINRAVLMARQIGAVLALGAIVFTIAAFAATHLIFTETLDGSQSASAGYSVK